jgi:pimeloyl-ACP methyl ester carboxylesterase
MATVMKWLLGLAVAAAVLMTGGYFALKRSDIPYETLAETYANEASAYVDLPGGIRAHYRDQGARDGRTLLLVHGYSASLHTWEPWVKELSGAYRLVTVDLPGHGLTSAGPFEPTIANYAAFVNDFADALKLTQFTLVGNSMGGNTAWVYALAHPERVDALVLVDASGWPDPRMESEPVIFQILRHPVGAAVLRDLDNTGLIRQGLRASFANPMRVDDAMVARYSELSRAPGHRDILRDIMLSQRGYATADKLSKIAAPTLILHGEADNLIPVSSSKLFAAAIPGAQLITYPNVGHIPQEEIPQKSAADLRSFLERRTLAGAAAAVAAP